MSKDSPVRILVESALLIAIADVLNFVQFGAPQGGSVTALSMLPLVLIGLRRGPFWGFCSCLVYGGLQMIPPHPFYPPPAKTLWAFIVVILLDYIIAYGMLGFSSFFRKSRHPILISVAVCFTLRFVCHFISGILVWSSYAGDTPVWIYSLLYNGSYMGIEMILSLVAGVFLEKRGILTR